MRIALLEDDHDQAALMRCWLEDAGHTCHHFARGEALIRALQQDSFDLLLIDWMLPDIGGDEVLDWVRQHLGWQIPVIFVTARDSAEHIVNALERGADDYMTKPVVAIEMLARVAALGRRAHGGSPHVVPNCMPYNIDLDTRTIHYSDQMIPLTHKEFDLAVHLFRNAGRLLSRAHILEAVWGRNPQLNTRTVDTHMSRLRKKLKLDDATGWRLSGVYQHGYRLERIET